mgnify:CR=1 FL=1|jgi:Response regulator containing CheY-like receiver domain and AraC-type DNA-binding domain
MFFISRATVHRATSKPSRPSWNILIVEDQWLLSSAVEEAVLSLGHEAIGTATSAKEAYELADKAEVAFVDVNLIDRATGPVIRNSLAQASMALSA